MGDRGRRYGSVEECFDRCAKLATILLGKHITLYDVSIIMMSMKMARIPSSPTHEDNYVDGINYLAFASQFSTSEEQAKVALEEDIAAMARKFAPRRPEMVQPAPVQQPPAPTPQQPAPMPKQEATEPPKPQD